VRLTAFGNPPDVVEALGRIKAIGK
jgi:hypothetical protein